MSFDNNPTAVRVYALQEAVKFLNQDGTAGAVIETAEAFLAFLNGTGVANAATPAATSATTAAKAKTTAKSTSGATMKATPAASASSSKPVKAEPTAEEVFETRKKLIGAKVEAALAANKRAEAVELMKSYGATSVTALAQTDADITEVLEKFDEILLAA